MVRANVTECAMAAYKEKKLVKLVIKEERSVVALTKHSGSENILQTPNSHAKHEEKSAIHCNLNPCKLSHTLPTTHLSLRTSQPYNILDIRCTTVNS